MNFRNTITRLFLVLLLAGCYPDDFYEHQEGAFYKLYGNGTYQEAVAMNLSQEGDIYIAGNQYVRNQDSSAVILIRANAEGNQVWSRKFFGKGHTTSRALINLQGNELLVLASSRPQESSKSVPVLFRINYQGELIKEYYLEPEEDEMEAALAWVPEGLVTGESGDVYILGNIREANGLSRRSFIKRIDLQTGQVLDKREFSNSEETEALQIFKEGDQYLVVGNTRQEVGELKELNLFLASFSVNLVEADHAVIGSSESDYFRKAILNSSHEIVIVSSEQIPGTTNSRGVVRFADPRSFRLRQTAYLDFSANEIPEAIEEDEEGGFLVAVNSFGERGNADILINRVDLSGTALWESSRMIGGDGSDKVTQLEIKDGFVYLLKTVDMQNENTLISLSRIRF